MADTKTVIERAYSAFNKRDIDGALALMTQDVNWPKASEGGKVVGKEEIRAYWARQWAEFDPHVEPLAIAEEDGGKICVRVRQLVKSLQGDVLSDSVVTSRMRPIPPPVHLPHSHIDPNWLYRGV
jgi:hypothetical protein